MTWVVWWVDFNIIFYPNIVTFLKALKALLCQIFFYWFPTHNVNIDINGFVHTPDSCFLSVGETVWWWSGDTFQDDTRWHQRLENPLSQHRTVIKHIPRSSEYIFIQCNRFKLIIILLYNPCHNPNIVGILFLWKFFLSI